jgi:TPR repeat protein
VPVTQCDHLAATPGYVAGVRGVTPAFLDATRAVPACREAVGRHPGEARLQAWLGRSLQKAGNLAEARLWYDKAAEKSHPVALNNLGRMYMDGKVVPQDYAKARSLYQKAANLGEPAAMTNIGILFRNGYGVQRDYTTARIWFEKAAAKGEPSAMYNIGRLYTFGEGVQRDYATARSWYEKAAAMGSAAAMNNLGVAYSNGHGVAQSDAIARSWYEKAAAKGSQIAMRNVALFYARGRGGPINPQGAARHLLASARLGNVDSRGDLDEDMGHWPPAVRMAVQALLAASGDYRGGIHGRWDQPSRAAARAYYMRPS